MEDQFVQSEDNDWENVSGGTWNVIDAIGDDDGSVYYRFATDGKNTLQPMNNVTLRLHELGVSDEDIARMANCASDAMERFHSLLQHHLLVKIMPDGKMLYSIIPSNYIGKWQTELR